MDTMTVLIVDDHTVAREGLRAMLETDRSVQVVGEAADGQEAMELVSTLRPKVVLMDIRMPGMDGLEVTRLLKTEHPTIAVVIVTSYDDDALVVGAVRAGAAGYLLKDASRALLIHTIGAVLSGGLLVKAGLLRKALDSLRSYDTTDQATRPKELASPILAGVEPLTAREHEVLRMVAEGRRNKEIADTMALAEVTVKKHVQSIIAKLHVSDRTQAATVGMRIGLIG